MSRSYSMSVQVEGYWRVSFRRGDDRRDLMVSGYPKGQWYTDAELAEFEPFDPAKHNRKRATAGA